MLCATSIILAMSILTATNSVHFVSTDWMPISVAPSATPGSPDYIFHNSLTVNDAAALRAICDGYCQRIYFMNCGRINHWATNEYGGLELTDFTFPANFGDRTKPPSRAIGFTNYMEAVASHIAFTQFQIRRPSWPGRDIHIGSTCLKIDDDTLLDPYGLYGLSQWSQTISPGPMAILRSLHADDKYNPTPITNLWYETWRSIGHGEPYLSNLVATASAQCDVTYEGAVSNTLGATTWSVANITNIPHRLDRTNAWMGAASQALTFIDRSYDFVDVHSPTSLSRKSYSTDIRATYTATGTYTVNIDTWSGYGEITPTVSVGSNDWNIGSMTSRTNDLGNAYYDGGHFQDVKITRGSSTKDFITSSTTVSEHAISHQDAENAMRTLVFSSSTNSFVIYSNAVLDYPSYVALYLFMPELASSCEIYRMSYERSYTLSELPIVCAVGKHYTVNKTTTDGCGIDMNDIRMTKDENPYAKEQQTSVLGAVLINASDSLLDKYDGDPDTMTLYGQSSPLADPSISSMSNSVRAFASSVMTALETAKSIIGNYDNPMSFATIGADDARSEGTISSAALGFDYPKGRYYGKCICRDDGSISIADYYYVDETETTTNRLIWGATEPFCKLSVNITPNYYTMDSTPPRVTPAHRAVSDAKMAVMTDFEFDALKNSP